MHEFKSDFYGHDMQAVVLGYIRPELDYTSRGQYIITMFLITSLISSCTVRGSDRRHQHGQACGAQIVVQGSLHEIWR